MPRPLREKKKRDCLKKIGAGEAGVGDEGQFNTGVRCKKFNHGSTNGLNGDKSGRLNNLGVKVVNLKNF